MTAPWRSGEISRLEPQKSCSARAKQSQTSSQIRQIYIEYHRVNRAIEIHWVHSTSPAPMNCPTSGWLARLCWQTSPLGEPAGNATRVNILSLFVNTNDIIYTSKQFKSIQHKSLLYCFPKEQHENNMAFRWRIGNKPELSMCPPSPILYFAAACSRHRSDTMWHVTQCDKIFDNVILDLPKGKTWENDAFSCFSSGYKSDTLFKSGLWGRNSSGGDWPHCRDRNQCLISPGMSKHILGWPSDSAQKICLH